MPRAPDPNKELAKELYFSGKKLIEIANQLNLPEGTIRGWKSRYKWDCNATSNKRNVTKRKKGGQPGNKNSVGHASSSPLRNKYAVKNHLFEKYLPQETLDIINSMPQSPADILFDNIQLANAAIIRAQQINFVKSSDEHTKILQMQSSGESSDTVAYHIQSADERQNSFMKSQAVAMSSLRSMIKQYDELMRSPLATEEQKLRIEKLKAETAKLKGTDNQVAIDKLDEVLSSIKGVI